MKVCSGCTRAGEVIQMNKDGLRKVRIAEIVFALFLLFWLPVEDVHLRWVLLIASVFCSLIVLHLATMGILRLEKSLPRYLVTGIVAGLSVPLVAVFLMAFKTGLHGHATPDFTGLQIQVVMRRIPAWIAGGSLLGLGVGLLRLGAHQDSIKETLDAAHG